MNQAGGSISTADLLILTGYESTASLHDNFFSFLKQANPKYKEFSSTYTSPMTERRQSLRMQQVCELSSPVFKPAAAERARTRLKSSSKFLAVFEKDLHAVLSGRGRCRRHRR